MRHIKKLSIIVLYLSIFIGCKFPTFNLFKRPTDHITQSSSVKDVLKFAQKNDLVIFDIDETLVESYLPDLQGKKHFFEYGLYKLLNDYIMEKAIKKNLPIIQEKLNIQNKEKVISKSLENYLSPFVNEKMQHIWSKLEPKIKFTATEKGIPQLMEELQKRDCKTMAFTAREWKIRKDTKEDLKTIDIDMSKNTIYNKKISEEPTNNHYGFGYNGKGILFLIRCKEFTYRTEKGRVLLNFFNKINYKPVKVIFIDNRMDNVKGVVEHLLSKNIPIQGIWYKYKGYKENPILHKDEIPIIDKYLGKDWQKLDINIEKATEFIKKRI